MSESGNASSDTVQSKTLNLSYPQEHALVPIGLISPSNRTLAAYADPQLSQTPTIRLRLSCSFIMGYKPDPSTFKPLYNISGSCNILKLTLNRSLSTGTAPDRAQVDPRALGILVLLVGLLFMAAISVGVMFP